MSSSELTDTDTEPSRTVDPQQESDWAEWTDVEPDSDDDITMIAVRLSAPPKTEPEVEPPVYTQPDQPIEIPDKPTQPSPAKTTPTERPSDTIVTPAPTTSTAPAHIAAGDPTVRRPTKPAHPYAPQLRKLRATPPIPQPIIRSPTAIQEAGKRTRICSVNHVAVKTVDFSKTTEQLTHELTQTHALNAYEQKQYLREMRLMRVGQKALV